MSTMDYKEEAKIWMKKPNWMKIELKKDKFLSYIHNVYECRDILLNCNILCSQLNLTANMKKKNPD
jgi:hypothetical protein